MHFVFFALLVLLPAVCQSADEKTFDLVTRTTITALVHDLFSSSTITSDQTEDGIYMNNTYSEWTVVMPDDDFKSQVMFIDEFSVIGKDDYVRINDSHGVTKQFDMDTYPTLDVPYNFTGNLTVVFETGFRTQHAGSGFKLKVSKPGSDLANEDVDEDVDDDTKGSLSLSFTFPLVPFSRENPWNFKALSIRTCHLVWECFHSLLHVRMSWSKESTLNTSGERRAI